jgi:hypothetical protein
MNMKKKLMVIALILAVLLSLFNGYFSLGHARPD